MFGDDISDFRQQKMLRAYLKDSPSKKFNNLLKCSTGIIRQTGADAGVFLLANEQHESKIFGTLICHSPWACPHCTPIVMAKKGTDIACLIDALKAQNEWACMITFTMPHTQGMSCQKTFSIFQKAWRLFTRAGNRAKRPRYYTLKADIDEKNTRGGKPVGKKGETRVYQVGQDAYGKFRSELGITHIVKVWEFTVGHNSWHPHIHALFWTPKQKFKHVPDYQKDLNARWLKCLKKCTADEYDKEFTDKLFEESKLESFGNSVYISLNNDGTPKRQESSFYITGWSGDAELTSKAKIARQGHYTPFQLLDKAQEAKTPEERNKWLSMFTEYAACTYGHRRVEFTKNCGPIVREWKKTNSYVEEYKKKFTSETAKSWRVVYWFNQEQWSFICFKDKHSETDIIAQLLLKARTFNPTVIDDFLQSLNIPITTRENREAALIENFANYGSIIKPTNAVESRSDVA